MQPLQPVKGSVNRQPRQSPTFSAWGVKHPIWMLQKLQVLTLQADQSPAAPSPKYCPPAFLPSSQSVQRCALFWKQTSQVFGSPIAAAGATAAPCSS